MRNADAAAIAPARRWIDSPLAAALLAAIAYAALTVSLVRARGGDISRFVIAGGSSVDAAHVPEGLTVYRNIGGYDGIFFYRLALDPFTSVQQRYGITLDNPPYRQQRIGYPLIVWMLSLGRAVLVPPLLVLVNIAAASMMAASAAAFSRRLGHHALWGLIVPLYPGFVLTLSRDLSEIVAASFAMAAIWAVTARRNVAAAILLTCAVLTRETTLLLAAALLGAYCIERLRKREQRIAPLVFALPILTYVAWQWFLTMRWGVSPLRAGAPDRVLPFVEYARFLAAASARRYHLQRLYFTECLFIGSILLTAIALARRSRAAMQWWLAWIGYVALFSILPHSIWMEDFGFLRIFSDLFLVSATIVIASESTAARWLTLLTTAGLWYYLGQHTIAIG